MSHPGHQIMGVAWIAVFPCPPHGSAAPSTGSRLKSAANWHGRQQFFPTSCFVEDGI
jgi:hypothetical protein